jgi:hypothetical protein
MTNVFQFKKITKIVPLSLFLAGAAFLAGNLALAKEPEWVLKETPAKQFLCSEGIHCVNPSAMIDSGSAKMSFGLSDDCPAVYSINAAWPNLPETIKPGESQNTPLSISVTQDVSCPAALAEKADVSLMFGKAMPPETPSNYSNAGYAEVTEFPTLGKSKNAEATAIWTVPTGESGELLHVRVSASLKSGLGGYATYVYEYQEDGIKTAEFASKKDEISDDVCAIGLRKSASLFPLPIKIASARDSGARFSDLSGEVTIAPGSDPKDAQPAEMDMVIDTGSIIKTEAESTAIISFADMTTFCMKPFTTVIMDTPPEKGSKWSLLSGKVWANVKQMMKDGTMNVTMNQAVAGIKGTVLILEENGQESILKVVDGDVEYTAKKDSAKVMVAKGEMVRARDSGLMPKESFDIEAERHNWQEFVPSVEKSGASASTNGSGKSGVVFAIVIVITIVIGGVWVVRKKKAMM